jgi:hypothetical protein
MSIYSLKDLKTVLIGRETSYGVIGTISESIGASDETLQLSIPNENVTQIIGRREVA